MVKAVRGAVQLGEDTSDAMEQWVPLLVERTLQDNSIHEEQVVSIIFSQTEDLTACNPATALRKIGYESVPLFCTIEPQYPESLPFTVRILVTYDAEKESNPMPVYLNGAEVLRKDLFQNEK